ncbi:MAG: alkaline phosphatase family protein, partial [Candidatus Eremiobacteraeota bacterium]|nr:alkaline phosphatase family protein [Candidatus Eremiobacteraeota bacterium]
HAVGKIEDIFAGQGIVSAVHTKDNMAGVDETLRALRERDETGLIFTNLVDFDAVYGHRNNPAGYAGALEQFDGRVPELLAALKPDDLLVITADHGNDPTFPGTDHTREYVPILLSGAQIQRGANIGVRATFADLAATLAEYLGVSAPNQGTSFWEEIRKK